MKIFIKSAWGSDDPARASFPCLQWNALAEAGHEVQIFMGTFIIGVCGGVILK